VQSTGDKAAVARFEGLDLLRVAAVLAVALFHYGFAGPGADFADVPLFQTRPIAQYGFLGVQLFFVISGFVIAYSAEGRSATGFAIARAARIYPAFLFCMTVTFLAVLAFGAPRLETSISQWAANLFIAAPALNRPYMDKAYWSIVSELTFYGWIYLLLVSGLFRRHLYTVLLCWLALSLLNQTVLGSELIRKAFLTDQSGFFAAGVLLYGMHRGDRSGRVQLLLAFAAACAVVQALGNSAWVRDHYITATIDNWIVAGLCLAAIAAVTFAVRVRRVPLPSGLILAIGGLTYPFYLLHQNVGYAVLNQLQEFAPQAVLVPVILLALVLASWATWRYVERPGQRLLKNLLFRVARPLGLGKPTAAEATRGRGSL
jgi:peptidoglycan/LPS O-acetylase OafA/YrhL